LILVRAALRGVRTSCLATTADSETLVSTVIEKRRVSDARDAGTCRAPTGFMTPDDHDIDERSFTFFCNVIAFVETVPLSARTSRIIEQLVDSAGSIGSNRDEAAGGSSRGEFIRFNENSLRGANNSVQWLQVCADRKIGSQEKCVSVLNEGRQLARTLSRIVITAKRRGNDPRARIE
jgi:four helix bundle protein